MKKFLLLILGLLIAFSVSARPTFSATAVADKGSPPNMENIINDQSFNQYFCETPEIFAVIPVSPPCGLYNNSTNTANQKNDPAETNTAEWTQFALVSSNAGIRGPGDHSLLGLTTEPAHYMAAMLQSNNTKEDAATSEMEIGGPDIVWCLGKTRLRRSQLNLQYTPCITGVFFYLTLFAFYISSYLKKNNTNH